MRSQRIKDLGYDYTGREKLPFRPCNLCGADRWVILTHSDRYGYSATTTACSVCGLTMLNPSMTSEEYGKFYQNVYRPLVSAYHGRLIDAKTVQEDQHPYASQMVSLVEPLMRSSYKSMLDVGGSTGLISSYFAKKFSLKCTVIDPAPDEIEEAKAMGIEAVTGFVEEWDGRGQRFDVIGIFQTIDHLLDVHLTLTKLRELIADDGLLLVDIVDFRAAYLRNQSIEESVKIDHVYSFTQEVMEAYLAKVGFEWVRKSFADDHLHVLYFCKPVKPKAEFLPSEQWVEEYFREIRKIQNLPK